MNRSEWIRKFIHLLSICFPLCYAYFGYGITVRLLSVLTVLCIGLDLLRMNITGINQFYCQQFGFLLRQHEHTPSLKRYSGLTSMVLGMLLTVLIFPTSIAILALLVLIISDACAVIVGKTFPIMRLLGHKSLGGMLGFAISAIALVFLVTQWYDESAEFMIAGWISACLTAVAELVAPQWKLDDNLVIPLIFGSLMWGLMGLMAL